MERACPICGRQVRVKLDGSGSPEISGLFPFCSQQCRSVDLGRWFNGEYVIPGHLQAEDLDSADFNAEGQL
jgi:uncharacterized protein